MAWWRDWRRSNRRRTRRSRKVIIVAGGFQHMMIRVPVLVSCLAAWALTAFAAEAGVACHGSEPAIEYLQNREQEGLTTSTHKPGINDPHPVGYSSDRYLIGNGQGDLSKGALVCQRVSELSARTDLAKQIRVLVKEHMVDRIREQSGRSTDQDIQLTREEIVQEYLQGVQIVDRRIDEETHTCSATAVMPKTRIEQLQPGDGRRESAPVNRR
jgi:hypothetical protein